MQNWLQNKNQIDMTDLLVILGFPVSPMSPMSLTFCPPRCPLILLESRSIICERRRLRQIIDLRATDKSRYFAITVFNNCFIIRSPSLFLRNIFGRRSDLPFSCKSDRKKEKTGRGFIYAWAE